MLDQNPDNMRNDQLNAFLRLMTVHQPRIYGFIMSLVGDWNAADDIYQETTSVLWSKFNEFTPGTDFVSWSLKIARFQVLSHIKKKKIQRNYFTEATLENLSQAAMQINEDSSNLIDALRACVKKLSQRSRELLRVRYQDEESVSNIATRYHLNINTLYKQYQKIHAQLFRCIRSRSERSL